MTLQIASDQLNQADVPLWLITAEVEDQLGGLIATFVQTASLVADMPRVVVGLAKHHHTTSLIAESRVFGLHSLSEANIDLVWHFGMQSGKAANKFADIDYELNQGVPLLRNVPLTMQCQVEAVMDAGDRLLFLSAIESVEKNFDAQPLFRNRMVELATPEQLAEMRRQRETDSETDRRAIELWRIMQAGDASQ